MVACGTAYYACAVAKYWFEQVAGIPCDIDIASEFRYREPPLPKDGLALFVSQSGETLDTLEALRFCKKQGQTILSIVNTVESTIERESDLVLHTLAGPEIGVASTKALTTQLTTLACMALCIARENDSIDAGEEKTMTDALRHIPQQITDVLHDEERNKNIQGIARDIFESAHMLYLGRNLLFPLAMEGALKMKEVSYIHAEGYAAGELKHGPIALIDEQMPIAVFAPGHDPLFEKTASNLQENVARGAKVLLVSDEKGLKELEQFFEMVDSHAGCRSVRRTFALCCACAIARLPCCGDQGYGCRPTAKPPPNPLRWSSFRLAVTVNTKIFHLALI